MSDANTPPPDPGYEDLMAGIGRYESRLAVSNAKTKKGLIAALAAAGIAKVTVVFDGFGDSGAVEDVEVAGPTGEAVKLPWTPVAVFDAGYRDDDPETQKVLPLPVAIRLLAMSYLSQTHGGWENNDGGFGDVVFDVAAGTATLDYNERFTDTTNYSHEF